MSFNGRELLHGQLARRPTSYTTKAAADEALAIFKATSPEQLAVHVKERLHPGDTHAHTHTHLHAELDSMH